MPPKRPLPNSESLPAAAVEDDDYMSDSILLLGSSFTNGDPTPYSKKRRMDVQRGLERGKVTSLAAREEDSRAKGLNDRIGEENVGFKMLTKMGWNQGSALGPSRSEPQRTPITKDNEYPTVDLLNPYPSSCAKVRWLRSRSQTMFYNLAYFAARYPGRTGLGLAPALTPVQAARLAATERAHRIEMDHAQRKTQFIGAVRAREMERQDREDVARARRTVREIDEREGVPPNPLWPPVEGADPIDCTLQHEGYSKEVVEVEESNESTESTDGTAPNEVPFNDLPLNLQLPTLLHYLRNTYRYCLYCGARYDTDQEMRDECPGEARDEHDGD
ncbi:hypothetical protein HDU93_008049 [Gonapodya sp. JEL0774]|nr:hypothetical protein HDU93_008049 [Gonapodya sp. JEL0774]